MVGRGRSGWPSTRPSPTCAAAPTSTTPARRSSARRSPGGSAQEGLRLDVCSGGELAVAIRAGLPGGRITLHGNNKPTAEIEAALRHGVGRIVVDSFEEIERIAHVATRARRRRPGAAAGHRRGRGAHPRVHLHRPRGPEVRASPGRRSGRRGGPAGPRPPAGSRCGVCTATSAPRSSTSAGSRWPPAGCWTSGCGSPASTGVELPELDLGGGFGIAYTTEHDPLPPADLAAGMAEIVGRSAAPTASTCPGSRSSPDGRSPARAPSRSTRWAPSRTSSSTAARPAPTCPSTAA